MFFAGKDVPENWMERNGANFDSGKWPALAKVLGSSALPDDRGLFIRGYDPTGINDSEGPSRRFASFQEGSFLPKNTQYNWPLGFVAVGSGSSPQLTNHGLNWDNFTGEGPQAQIGWPEGSGHGTADPEDVGVARPKNRNYLPIVYAGAPVT